MLSIPFNLAKILDRPIAYQRVFVSLGVGVTGAVLLSQAIYWSSRTSDGDGWFFKTQTDWEDETGLTRREQEGARKRLRAVGVLQEKRGGVPAKLYFRVNFAKLWDKLAELYGPDEPPTNQSAPNSQTGGNTGFLPQNSEFEGRTNKDAQNRHTGLAQTARQDARKPPNPYTETTSEITTNYTERAGEHEKIDFDDLQNKLIEAGSDAIADPVTAPSLLTLSEPLRWLEQGCDLHLDILPTIKARTARAAPGTIRSWSYFTQGVAEAKARREQPMPAAIAAKSPTNEPDWRRKKRERFDRDGIMLAEMQRRIDAGLPPMPPGGFDTAGQPVQLAEAA